MTTGLHVYEGLDFEDLTVVEVPIRLNGKTYTLREATGDASCKYHNALLECSQLGPEGKLQRVRGMADLGPKLVAMCLFDENNRPVSEATIRSWPARVQDAMFKKVKEISLLEEPDTIESLEKERAEVDRKLAALSKKNQEAASKGDSPNQPATTTTGSA